MEVVLDLVWIWHGPLHPIDFPTYMQQIEKWLNGECDYFFIDGKTGPMVYPAIHAWLFRGIYWLTAGGDMKRAQKIFMLCQLATSWFVFGVLDKISTKPWIDAAFLWFTVRGRNVWVNGLFNDAPEVMFVYLGYKMMVSQPRTSKRWSWIIFVFSLAVGIKMSALLHATGLIVVCLYEIGLSGTIQAALPSVLFHVLMAWPFLKCEPWHYLHNSFEFTRRFHWFLSMNWKWLPEWLFHHRVWHTLLLVATILGQAILAKRWINAPKTNSRLIEYLWTSHFVGIAFSRSLHYSFWSWYYHTIPFILHFVALPVRIALFALLEVAWNFWQPHRPTDMKNSFAVIRGSQFMTIGHFLILALILKRALQ